MHARDVRGARPRDRVDLVHGPQWASDAWSAPSAASPSTASRSTSPACARMAASLQQPRSQLLDRPIDDVAHSATSRTANASARASPVSRALAAQEPLQDLEGWVDKASRVTNGPNAPTPWLRSMPSTSTIATFR